ncbi:MAG: hypothetical protein AABY87_09870 [bacterium]
MGYLTWDVTISDDEFREILRDPSDERFAWSVARLLSRASFWDVFTRFISPKAFLEAWPRIKDQLRLDPIGIGRIEFWDWVFDKIQRGSGL